MSERLTEIIVRKFLKDKGYYDNPSIFVEEQQSKFKNIKLLLSKASKKKTGNAGYPEFIISSPSFPEYLVIIECKSNLSQHQSNKFNDPQNFNVDGCKWYSKFLSKSFNVISFAITGKKKENLKISSFVQKKNKEFTKFKNDKNTSVSKILPFSELVEISGYDKQEAELLIFDILKFSRSLHEFLRDYAKLSEAQKPLVVCGTLIALKDDKFRNNFYKNNIKKLPNFWYEGLKREINKAKIPHLKKDHILNSFLTLKDHPPLNRSNPKFSSGVFFELIKNINDYVFPYISILKNYDIIGRFFNEFLKYSGGDKQSFGIVLTPKHITEFMVKLSGANLNTKVIDTCCGTGGFLVAAMDEMLKKAFSKSDKIKILSENLVGCEDLPEMFTLAAGNMILRGDGKANLYQGDSFNKKIFKILKNHKADIGLINPPFSQKEEEIKELAYVSNMLSIIKKGGIGIAILPMNCSINPSELKNEILKNNTLLASLSMPDKLFYPVGTVTCILVFKAGYEHPKKFKTWLAYCKDDGFYNKHHRGRNDFDNKWKEIESEWVNNFKNREVVENFSLLKELNEHDEWSVEKYMDIDYSKIDKNEFNKMVKENLKSKVFN